MLRLGTLCFHGQAITSTHVCYFLCLCLLPTLMSYGLGRSGPGPRPSLIVIRYQDGIVVVRVNINPFTHTIETASRLLATSEPSAATARLQVIRMSCDLASLLPATRLLFDRLGFERLDRSGHGCCMMRDAPRGLRKATDVNVGFRYTRAHGTQPPR